MCSKVYYSSLDGLRAFSIILVMLLHAHFQLGKGGGIGVEMFFVLSGFLITNSLLYQYDRFGFISLKKFWIQQLLRIFPALLGLLTFVFVISFVFFPSERSIFIKKEIVYSFFYVSNISWLWEKSNFDKLLGHTWSLSVENQFYLIWPIFLLFSIRNMKNKRFILISVLILIGLGFLKLFKIFPEVFNSLFFLSIYLGCFLAIILRNKWIEKFEYPLVSLLAFFILICIGIFKLDYQGILFDQHLINLVVPSLTIIILLNSIFNPHSRLSVLLSNKIITFIGKISYGLYLWHLPVFRIFGMRTYFSPSITFILKFVVSFLFAVMSYYLFEKKVINYFKIRYSF